MDRRRLSNEVTALLEALEDVERRCVGRLPTEASAFRRTGRYLIAEAWLMRRLTARLRSLDDGDVPPPLRALGAGRLLGARLLGQRLPLLSSAEAIVFDRNVRAFYRREQGITIKLRGPAAERCAMAREVEARRSVEKTGTLRIPRLFDFELTAAQPFLAEAAISGRRATPAADGAAVEEQVLPQFCGHYAKHGIAAVRCGTYFELASIKHRALAVLGAMGAAAPNWLERLEDLRDAELPGSLGHGDLSLGNMLVDADRVLWVVDWERAGPMPIIWDWRKLFEQVPPARNAYAQFMNRIYGAANPAAEVLPLREQWRLLLAARLAETSDLLEADRSRRTHRRQRRLRMTQAWAVRCLGADDIASTESGLPPRPKAAT